MEPDVPGWGQGGRQAGAAALVRRLGWVGGSSSGVARDTLGRTPGCPFPPILQGRHHCLQTGAAKLLTDSRIHLVHRDNQVQGGTWEVPRPPDGQKYVLAAPQAPLCCGLSMLAPLLAEEELP